jgi:GAF domain-containing protein
MARAAEALAALGELARALRAPASAAEAFARLDAALAPVFAHTHLTINRYDAATDETARVYSSAPAIYPLAGRKRRKTNGWSEQVIDRGEIHLAADHAAVVRTFDDHAGITALGCASVLNVPVRFDGRTLGVLNLMGPAGRFEGCDRTIALAFAGLMIPVLSTR